MQKTRFLHFLDEFGKRFAALLLGLFFLTAYACGERNETDFSSSGLPTGQIDPSATIDPSVASDDLEATIRLLVKNDLREKGDNQAMRQCIANYVSTFQMYYPNVFLLVLHKFQVLSSVILCNPIIKILIILAN